MNVKMTALHAAVAMAFLIFGLSAPSVAQSRALVCYYGSNGAQTDADSCRIGMHLSYHGTVQLNPRCSDRQDAVCHIGHKGPCMPGSRSYATYRVFDRQSTHTCPPQYVAGRNGGGTIVRPSCPQGYVLSGSQCVQQAQPEPVPVPVPTPSASFEIRRGFDLPGGDYATLRGKVSYQACFSSCQRDSRCLAFTFNTRFSKCFLKSRVTNWKRFGNAISGWRQAPAHQPQSTGFGGFSAYVVGLQPNEIISIRSEPARGRNKVGALPSHAENIQVRWCDNHNGGRWCEIVWQGIRGWVPERFLRNVEGGQ